MYLDDRLQLPYGERLAEDANLFPWQAPVVRRRRRLGIDMSNFRQDQYEDVAVHNNRCPVCWNLCSLWQSACFVCDSRFSMTRILESGRTERLVSATSVAEVFSDSAKLSDLSRGKVRKMALSTVSSSSGGFHGAVHGILKAAQRFQTSFFSTEFDHEQRRTRAADARGGPYWF